MNHLKSTYVPFILLGTQRTGSNYLADLLNYHPSVVMAGELFNKEKIWGRPGKRELENNPFTLLYRNMLPIHFLQHKLYTHYPTTVQAVGFRLFYQHLPHFPTLIPFLTSIPKFSLIHLTRVNLLDQYVSLQIARQTNIWHSDTYRRTIPTIYIDTDDCLRYFAQIESERESAMNQFQNIPKLHISYDDLHTSSQHSVKSIETFLHIPEHPLQSSLKKQVKEPLHNVVRNFAEVTIAIKKTKWRSFVTR